MILEELAANIDESNYMFLKMAKALYIKMKNFTSFAAWLIVCFMLVEQQITPTDANIQNGKKK